MAKEIDLTKRVVAAKPEAPKKRVDPAGLRTPPPASAPRMIPLAPGQVVPAAGGGPALTPMERAALERQGWKQGDPVPQEIAQVAAAIRQEASTYVPPVDPNTPPLRVETVDISQVDPLKQAEIRQVLEGLGQPTDRPIPPRRQPNLQGVLKQPPAAPQPVPRATTPSNPPVAQMIQQEEQAVSIGSQAVPGYRPPGQPFYTPQVPNPRAYPDPGVAAAQPPQVDMSANDFSVEVDIPPPSLPSRPTDVPPEMPPEQVKELMDAYATGPQEPPPADTPSAFGGPTLTHCPHCQWDLALPDIPEPDYGEKQAFLQAVLGQKPFIKDYSLLGGAVQVRFRTLTTKEVDLVYGQVLWERDKGAIATPEDYWEKINRYRLFLQTCQFTAGPAFHFDLPDGYDAESNPYAEAHWKFNQPESPRDTGLPQIENFMVTEVFRTEPIMRIIHNQCGQFNRLVARLEAMVDNSDFWKATGEQS